MEYTALIVAAGSGSRMGLGYNKLLFTLKNGKTILEETISKFEADERCAQIIVVTSEDDLDTFKKLLEGKNITFTLGGKTRQDSVYNGLKLVCSEYVFIHDGARPWVSQDCLDRLALEVKKKKACILMVPVKDTIKVVKDGKIVSTPTRSTLYQAQTPQAFLTSSIVAAYWKAYEQNFQASDDAQLMEVCGDCEIYMVEGCYGNVKVTTKEDIIGK